MTPSAILYFKSPHAFRFLSLLLSVLPLSCLCSQLAHTQNILLRQQPVLPSFLLFSPRPWAAAAPWRWILILMSRAFFASSSFLLPIYFDTSQGKCFPSLHLFSSTRLPDFDTPHLQASIIIKCNEKTQWIIPLVLPCTPHPLDGTSSIPPFICTSTLDLQFLTSEPAA